MLTNAHSVDHSTQVKVKHRGSDKKYLAKVLAIGAECDLALLSIADDDFWRGVTPIALGKLPKLQDSVTVVGYPIGGDTISVTAGVVSRIEMTAYAHSSSELLGVQIDAAINSGNSGGPVFDNKGACVGVAFQSLNHQEADGIGYIVPVPVIKHFLLDVEKHKRYLGFPTLGVETQKLENSDLRAALGLPAGQNGVLVRRVEPTSAAGGVLQKGDVLLSFDAQPIACDGTVPFRVGERIGFGHLVSSKLVGDTARLRVWSQRREKSVDVTLTALRRLIPVHTEGQPPSYYIFAGLVFTTVCVPYLRSEYGKEWDFDSPVRILDKVLHGQVEFPGQQHVVIGQVLASEINVGYEDVVNTAVVAVNGVPVQHLRQLVELVEECTEPFLCIDLDNFSLIALSTEQARAATAAILETHSIPRQCSADVADALRSGGPGSARKRKTGRR